LGDFSEEDFEKISFNRSRISSLLKRRQEMNRTRKTKLSWMRTLARAKLPTGKRERLALFYYIYTIKPTGDSYVSWREMARICNCTWQEARDICRDFDKRGWLPPGEEMSPQQYWRMKKSVEA
jgi:hypothetical protein